ncbi:phosphoglycerate mutase [Beggiatoa sp. SS]|nr:phosphoglycerate mutase [Beggiatoa sp. SS]
MTEPCLRERHFGVLQSELKKTLPTRFPEIFHYFKANDPDYIIPEGESLKQFSERCITCLEGLAKKHVGERILVVTHGGVLVSLFKHTLGIPLSAPRHFLSLNTSINVFSYQDKRWTLEVWGDLGHLHGVLAVDDSSV